MGSTPAGFPVLRLRCFFPHQHRVVQVHGEMYAVQQKLDVMESKMLRPLMDQIDSAFQLHRGDSQQAKRGGGFVTVSKGGFVPVS